jgi:hypothetical protein
MSYNMVYRYWHFEGVFHLQVTLQIAVGSSDMFISGYITSDQKKHFVV